MEYEGKLGELERER